jgi:predicted dehydrogenase
MDALGAGAHVIVEKPITETLSQLETLLAHAAARRLTVVEDYNYLFNDAPTQIMQQIACGEFGDVIHVEVLICLDILGPSGFADPNAPHPALALSGGAIADFLPHLASLAHLFVGPHRSAHSIWTKRKQSILPFDEFRGVMENARGTASVGFSANSQPDAFWLRVYGERMQATANLFESRITFQRVGRGPKPITAFLNGLDEGRGVSGAAMGTLMRKFRGGQGAYSGMWSLIGRTYDAIADGTPLPVSAERILEVNRMVAALKPDGAAP